MPEIRVRAREPHDAEAVAEISNCPGVVAGTLQRPYQSVEEWRERMAGTEAGTYSLVAEVDGRVVGMLGLQTTARPRRRHAGQIGMAVHDDYQGRGVGTALMVAMIDLADNWIGLQRIELDVFTDNTPAVHLYQKFGFEIEGTARRFALRHGEYADVYMMARVR